MLFELGGTKKAIGTGRYGEANFLVRSLGPSLLQPDPSHRIRRNPRANAPGTRQSPIAISSNHIFTLFFAALVWKMADVIARGCAVVEENGSFV